MGRNLVCIACAIIALMFVAYPPCSASADGKRGTVIIKNIRSWSHPAKKVFEKHKIIVNKVELKNGGKYPIFYVKLPFDPQSFANDEYYNAFYLELLKANGWWNYSLEDEEDGIIITIAWDKKMQSCARIL
jgi:hypothetical protein